jgi:hypothetical protein
VSRATGSGGSPLNFTAALERLTAQRNCPSSFRSLRSRAASATNGAINPISQNRATEVDNGECGFSGQLTRLDKT